MIAVQIPQLASSRVTPECPHWCRVSPEEHALDVAELGGRLLHVSEIHGGEGWQVYHQLGVMPDGSPDPSRPHRWFVDSSGPHGLTTTEALGIGRAIWLLAIDGCPSTDALPELVVLEQ